MLKSFDLLIWLPVLSAVLGYILHSLSADGGASILDRFDVKARLPMSVVTVLVLVFGVGSGAVDSVLAGQDWQHALATAAAATVTGFFGVTRQHASSAGAAVLLLVVAGLFGTVQTGCAALRPVLHELEDEIQKVDDCLVDNQNLPDEQAFVKCGAAELEQQMSEDKRAAYREHLKRILGTARHATAVASVEAANRAEKETLSKLLNVQLAAEAHAKCDGGTK